MTRNKGGSFLFSSVNKDNMGSDLFHQQPLQIPGSGGLVRYPPSQVSFADDSGGVDNSNGALFSSFMSKTNHSHLQYLMKQELPPEKGFSSGEVTGNGSTVDGSYSAEMESQCLKKMNTNCSSNLSRQSSSPPQFFYGSGDSGNPSFIGLNNQINFSSSTPTIQDSFEFDSPFSHENGPKTSSQIHHYSLQSSASLEKSFDFQGNNGMVTCQIRAKRGFATHPRSIAERNRRTRISGKMKKLQQLFPNMNKQTNTADMLDLAVEYIKELQKQVTILTDTKAKCICLKTHQNDTRLHDNRSSKSSGVEND